MGKQLRWQALEPLGCSLPRNDEGVGSAGFAWEWNRYRLRHHRMLVKQPFDTAILVFRHARRGSLPGAYRYGRQFCRWILQSEFICCVPEPQELLGRALVEKIGIVFDRHAPMIRSADHDEAQVVDHPRRL